MHDDSNKKYGQNIMQLCEDSNLEYIKRNEAGEQEI